MSAFFVVIGLTLIASLLPLRTLGWVDDLAGIVRVPTVPFADVGMRVRGWLAGGPQPAIDDEHNLESLEEELNRARALANEWRRKAVRLAHENAELQRVRLADASSEEYRLVSARVVGRNTQSEGDIYEINVGSWRQGIEPGAVVVFRGANLIGRVSDVGRMKSSMVAITDRSISHLGAFITPADLAREDAAPGSEPIRVLLLRAKDGRLTAEVRRNDDVRIGDFVSLDDESWPSTAQSMIVGRIVELEDIADDPLRRRIFVMPQYDPGSLSTVMVKSQVAGAGEGDLGG